MTRFTKIVATLGFASDSPNKIAALVDAGVNVFRLNFSHGTQDEHAARIKSIRALEEKVGHAIGILADMQGPKYRIGTVEDGIVLEAGQMLQLDTDPKTGDASRVYLPHAEIFDALLPGHTLLLDDGKLRLTIREMGADFMRAEVMVGGPLMSRKGVNIPDVKLATSPLTEKDLSDLEFALKHGVDWVALSFVQSASDVLQARSIIGDRALLMSKIEKPAALDDIDDIIQASDGIMVARGDLGVELPPELVPSVQKNLVGKCRQIGKPVLVATQMLESMIQAPTPTRAEASDVATAVFDGADAVMLSAETAAGQYPVEAVEIMARIVTAAEGHVRKHPHDGPKRMPIEQTVYHAVAHAAAGLASAVEARALVAFTASGNTAVRIARERPGMPFFVFTPSVHVSRRLALLWGAQTIMQAETDYEEAVDEARAVLQAKQIVSGGDAMVIVAGMPFGLAGSTNSMRVVQI